MKRRSWTGRLLLKIPTGEKDCWRVKGRLDKLVAEHTRLIEGQTPRIALEPSPGKRPMLSVAGEGMAICNRYGVRREDMRPPEWQPFMWYTRVIKATPLRPWQPPRLLLSWSEATGYPVGPEALALVAPGAEHAALQRALREAE